MLSFRLIPIDAAHPMDFIAHTLARDAASALAQMAVEKGLGRLELCQQGEGQFRLEQIDRGIANVQQSWEAREAASP